MGRRARCFVTRHAHAGRPFVVTCATGNVPPFPCAQLGAHAADDKVAAVVVNVGEDERGRVVHQLGEQPGWMGRSA